MREGRSLGFVTITAVVVKQGPEKGDEVGSRP
jgi:hypothetical protein